LGNTGLELFGLRKAYATAYAKYRLMLPRGFLLQGLVEESASKQHKQMQSRTQMRLQGNSKCLQTTYTDAKQNTNETTTQQRMQANRITQMQSSMQMRQQRNSECVQTT
jgi:hypothetical protein